MFLHRTAALFIIGNDFSLQQDLLFANLLGHTISSIGGISACDVQNESLLHVIKNMSNHVEA